MRQGKKKKCDLLSRENGQLKPVPKMNSNDKYVKEPPEKGEWHV